MNVLQKIVNATINLSGEVAYCRSVAFDFDGYGNATKFFQVTDSTCGRREIEYHAQQRCFQQTG